MYGLLRSLFVLLAIPSIGFVTAALIKGYYGYSLRQDVSLNLDIMIAASLVAAIIGLGLLIFIGVAGTISRKSRNALLYLFKPGLYIVSSLLIILTILHAGILIGTIYYGEVALVNRIHFGIIIAVGLGAAFGVLVIIRSIFRFTKKISTVVCGYQMGRESQPRLWDFIGDIAHDIGTLPPDNIVCGLDPNFFVTEAKVTCIDGELSGRTLYCSIPLCRILSKNEFRSVVGHELAHHKGLDTKFSLHFYPIYTGTLTVLESFTDEEAEPSPVVLPAIAIFAFFLNSFAIAENKLSREREIIADGQGAAITSPQDTATALTKVHRYAPIWHLLTDQSIELLREEKMIINMSQVFDEMIRDVKEHYLDEEILESHAPHPTDSHPPLAVRLQYLNVETRSIWPKVISDVPKEESASSLIEKMEEIEQNLSSAHQGLLAHTIGL